MKTSGNSTTPRTYWKNKKKERKKKVIAKILTDDNFADMFGRMIPDFAQPVLEAGKAVSVRQVEHNRNAVRAAVVSLCDRAKPLLAWQSPWKKKIEECKHTYVSRKRYIHTYAECKFQPLHNSGAILSRYLPCPRPGAFLSCRQTMCG